MREKQEREALPKASGAIRLTEYDPPRRDGFVNRMDKDTTSFFFTNFLEEAQVVELWSLFAKHGRVGEVYVPNKRDKHGNRFGFVKFKEIKSLEALTARLEDVWMGTFRLRINLSLFGRNKRRAVPFQSQSEGGDLAK
ncbi:zinc finger CCCH domain-containing protein [Trifolium repens]|jgi:RNA recognition motif-containing protein|nr:zinc finger CCCH domain-containing protein [Trifolium repens]